MEELPDEEEESDENTEEEIDYTVVMQEEEQIPEGQGETSEIERQVPGGAVRRIVRNPGKLVRLVTDTKMPLKLPENLIYWNRCETRCESSKLVTHSQIQNF